MSEGGAGSRGGAMTWAGAVSILRPLNLAALWLAVEAGSRLSGGPSASMASLVPVLTAAFGYARNDAVDREADRRNRPGRPVPAGLLSRLAALAISSVFLAAATALAAAFVRDPARWALFGAGATLLYFYSPWLKASGPLGPLTVSGLASMAVLWGGLSGSAPARSLVAAALAGAVTFARECAKDLEDLPGDRAVGKETWPVRDGVEPVRVALRGGCIGALVLIPLPWLLGDCDGRYLAVVLIAAAPTLGWCAIRPPHGPSEARRASLALKIALLAGIAGLWLGATPR